MEDGSINHHHNQSPAISVAMEGRIFWEQEWQIGHVTITYATWCSLIGSTFEEAESIAASSIIVNIPLHGN